MTEISSNEQLMDMLFDAIFRSNRKRSSRLLLRMPDTSKQDYCDELMNLHGDESEEMKKLCFRLLEESPEGEEDLVLTLLKVSCPDQQALMLDEAFLLQSERQINSLTSQLNEARKKYADLRDELAEKENELEKHKESFRIPSFTAFDPPGSMNQISSSRGPDGFSRIANFFESSSKKDSETAASQSQLNNVRKCFSLDAPPEEILKAIASTLDIKSITPFKSEDPAIEAQETKDKIETSELRLVCQRLDRLLTYVRHHNISKYERMNRKKKESISLLELNDFNEAEPQKVVTRKIEPKSEPNNEEEKKNTNMFMKSLAKNLSLNRMLKISENANED